jgi:hypothetical protein
MTLASISPANRAERSADLGLDVRCEAAPLARTGHHLVGQLFRGGLHQILGLQVVSSHQLDQGLLTKVALDLLAHGLQPALLELPADEETHACSTTPRLRDTASRVPSPPHQAPPAMLLLATALQTRSPHLP